MRLIDADKLNEQLQALAYDDWNQGVSTSWADAYLHFTDLVDVQPTADVVERKKGHWVGIDDEPCETFECDVCGFVLEDWIFGAFYNFCPNCGSYMGGAEDEQ